MKQGAQGWCTGITQRDGMGREVEGGSGWDHMYTYGCFMSMYGKNHYNIVTSLQINLKNKSQKVEVTLEKIMFH